LAGEPHADPAAAPAAAASASASASTDAEHRRYAEQAQVAADALRRMQQQRDELAAARTRFLAAAAHDLRQPLAAVMIYADLLSQRLGAAEGTDEQTREYMRVLRQEIQALAGSFDAILDYSQLESGLVRVDRQPCRLRDVLADLERRFAPLAAERGLAFEVNLPEPHCVVRTDRELLTRVLSNLLANAVKYTRPPPDLRLGGGFDVGVRVRVRGLLATVYVMDRGPGIPDALRERIFDAGFQVGNPERDRRRGFGLGLATVRSVVQRALTDHGLRLASVPGRGSHFMVDVPLDLGARLPEADTFPVSVIDIRRKVLDGALVLVVEDDAGVRAGLAEVLRTAGAFVAEAGSLAEAERRLAEGDRPPDLVLTDWRLPQGASGLQVIEAARLATRAPALPCIVITADHLAAEAALQGLPALEVMRKPLGRKSLLTRLAAHYRVRPSPLEGL